MILIEGMHLMPVQEARYHAASQECWCHPRLDVEADADGQFGFVFYHSMFNERPPEPEFEE